ncbi:heterokaryon incompatibility protein [Truncatella angustata]|uniref:Heterokaryon incompatibility protein n=1 Tax=Truncatella angustata TaxID=152316 RepID=A0A9P8ZWY0_9PEZI|nr:heterokaryon incompatibility protein [Truncatella angustata]KAH6654227.1 heterokaryon incompatibility protein [Truncatella angustata]KAH8205737.1 hypothetical protein TruAng_000013 [Truncatella angustata]
MATKSQVNISYRRLDTSKQEFRLLELRPATSVEDRVECRMVTARLGDEPEYIALSSLYGEPTESETIIVSGRPVTITRHLAQALRHVRAVFFPNIQRSNERIAKQRKTPAWLRHLMKHINSILPDPDAEQRTPLRLWIDVLCVNQRDEREKLKQVNDMRQIYGGAQIVVGWLGVKLEHSDAGLSCLNEVEASMPKHWGDPGDREAHPEDYAPTHAWFAKIDHLWAPTPEGASCFTTPHWIGAQEIMYRPYFQRRWILEEISMARFPTFLIGDSILHWKQILRLNRLMEELKYADSNAFPVECRAGVAELPLETAQKLLDEFAKKRALEQAHILESSISSQNSKSVPGSSVVSSLH